MVAGETSGDLLAGRLIDGMQARWSDLRTFGIGGPQMVRRGMQAWWPQDKLAVHGFSWELIRRYREIVGIRRQLRERLLADRPDVFIGVDAPDFNLALEADLRASGTRTVHFVCPSVWAWRPQRMDLLRRAADHVLCIFPFEPELLARHGIDSTYVGHPLAGLIPMQPDRAEARRSLELPEGVPVLAILPGSRRSEIDYLAPLFFAAAVRMLAVRPNLHCIVPVAPGLRARIEAAARSSGLSRQLHLVDGHSHAALAACDTVLLASGTATLEAALFKRPMVIAYRMSWLSAALIGRKLLQPWVGLPNILNRRFVVPELLQDAATPAALADATLDWLDAAQHAPERLQELQDCFTTMHHQLLRDTSALATDAIARVVQA
jgi:lipid-A-disaccharide synthase